MNSPSHMMPAGPVDMVSTGTIARWIGVVALSFVLGFAASELADKITLPVVAANADVPLLEDWHGNVMRSHWTR